MTTERPRNPFDSWLPDDTEALALDDVTDPWAEDDEVEVELTDAQRAFLATLADQPEVPRLRDPEGALDPKFDS
jgi:hypothetical protein